MVVIATKCYVEGDARERTLDSLRSLIANQVGDLDVSVDITIQEDDFPAVAVSGPDATVAENVLAEEWGIIDPTVTAEEVAVGTLDSWSEEELVLDAGEPVSISADNLGLGPGTADQIRTRFGLVQHMPLRYVPGDDPALATSEQDRLYEWTRGSGRVNVNSATRAEVRATVNRAGHAQDIVTVERLGLLEQSIICKPSTDPPGLLADIGEYLPSELLCVVP